MPQAIPTATAPAPVAPVTDPAVEPIAPLTAPTVATDPPAEVETPPVAVEEDPLAAAFSRSMAEMRGDPVVEPPIVPAPEVAAPEPVVPVVVAPVVTPPPAPVKKKVSVISKQDADFIDSKTPVTPPPVVTPAPVTPPADADADYIATLTADQREELREAEVAERLFPERKGFKKALVEHFRKFDAQAEALIDADPQRTLDENDAEFVKLKSTRPTLRPHEAKKVQRQIGTDEAKADVDAAVAPKLADIEQNQRRIELTPKIEAWVDGPFIAGVKALVTSDPKSLVADAAKLIAEKGFDEASKQFPLEANVLREEGNFARARAAQFLLLKNQAIKFDPKNEIHTNVANFIKSECDLFAKNGGKLKVKDGRTFLPRAEFNQMCGSNVAEGATFNPQTWATKSYWTFTDSEIVDFLALNTKNRIEGRVNFELERAKANGFVRRPGGQSAVPQTQPTELNPPRAVTTAAPASAITQQPQAKPEGLDVGTVLYKT